MKRRGRAFTLVELPVTEGAPQQDNRGSKLASQGKRFTLVELLVVIDAQAVGRHVLHLRQR
ncbi:MAG: hypothetical protein ACYTGH_16340 [Planctomycetota bacterium]